MTTKMRVGLACAAMLALPAIALGGERPPDDTTYQDGSYQATSTDGGKKVDLGVAIYECDNPVPFSLEGLKVSKQGEYSHEGMTKNVAGEKYDLTVEGEFKSAKKAVQKTTIKKGGCKETEKVTMKALK